MPIKFGIFDHLDSNGKPVGEQYEDRLTLAEAYEQLGFYAYHIAEHHLSPQGRAPSPSVFLAALAQRTHALRLGPLVYTLCFNHPLRILEEICMLDQLSSGRLELGVGRGVSPIELGLYGVEVDVADQIYSEALEIVLKGLTSQHLSFRGRHFNYHELPIEMTAVQKPHPPLWMGVTRAESATIAAARGANIVCVGTCETVRQVANHYRRQWATLNHGKSDEPMVGMTRHIVVADSDKEAYDIGRRAYSVWHANRTYLWKRSGTATPARLTLPESFDEALSAGFCIIGSPDTIRDAVLQQVDRSGVSYLLCHLAFGDITRGEALNSARLFAEHVMQEQPYASFAASHHSA